MPRAVHGNLSADVIMTEGTDEPDFQLGGFEWSLWIGADSANKAHAKLSSAAAPQRSETYSFAEDWRALGNAIADCLGVKIKPSGEVVSAADPQTLVVLNASERALLKRLTAPSRFDLVDMPSVARSIDEIVSSIGHSTTIQSGTFILGFSATAGLGKAVYETPVEISQSTNSVSNWSGCEPI